MGGFNVGRQISDYFGWTSPATTKARKQVPASAAKKPVASARPQDRAQVRAQQGRATASLSLNKSQGMTSGAQELYAAMKRVDADANDGERREIAVELDAAAKTFGMDAKLMLAVYKHESGGIDPDARSHTGAKGLGQLTGIAIDETIRYADLGRKPFKAHKDTFKATKRDRSDIKNNVWTSVAYMKIMDQRTNTTGGMLKLYGDPNVKTYDRKVLAEYQNLFGKSYR